MTKTNEDFEPICETTFTETQSKKKIIVRLGAPLFDPEKGLYYCISELEGLELEGLEEGELKGFEEGRRARIYGGTHFEALTLALLRFRVSFAKLHGDFRNEERNPPYVLFPKEIPWAYGSDVYDRLCKMVDDEVQKIEDERTRRREAYERGKGD